MATIQTCLRALARYGRSIPGSLAVEYRSTFRPAAALLAAFALIAGVGYPLLLLGVGQRLFPHQAAGSLVRGSNGAIVGSELIGQGFSSPRYFHPRPSAAGSGYDAANSGATNLGPSNPKLIEGSREDSLDGVRQLAAAYRKVNDLSPGTPVPADAVTRSGSGLDPHISVLNAELQAGRVAAARRLDPEAVRELIARQSEARTLLFLGEPRVNVLELNRALDAMEER